MVKTPSQTLEKFIVRLPDGMRDAVGAAARTNGRSMNAEIVARLAESLRLSPPPDDTGEIPTSRMAREALALARANAKRLDRIEAVLTAGVPDFTKDPNAQEALAEIDAMLKKGE